MNGSDISFSIEPHYLQNPFYSPVLYVKLLEATVVSVQTESLHHLHTGAAVLGRTEALITELPFIILTTHASLI